MPITGDSTIVSITDPGRWNPGSFTAQQFTDYLDLRATLAASSGTVSFMRAYASADVRFAGEVWLQNGAIRSERTLSLACFDSSQDIVSFRAGPGPGTEQLRILASGTIASADASTLGLRSNVRNVTSEEHPSLLEAFRLLSAAVPASGQAYLVLRAGSATNNRLLTVFGDLTNGTTLEFSTSGDGASGNLKDTTIRANSLKFNNAAGTRLTVTNSGSLQVTPESGSHAKVELNATASGSGRNWSAYSDQSNGYLRFYDETGAGTRLALTSAGNAIVVAPTANNAKVTLDSTASGGPAKSWSVFSSRSDGHLRFFDEGLASARMALSPQAVLQLTPASGSDARLELDSTASGGSAVSWALYSDRSSGSLKLDRAAADRTLEYDGDGDLKPFRLLATKVDTLANRPSSGVPDGAVFFDTTNTRLWVYVAGTTTWHYANFT